MRKKITIRVIIMAFVIAGIFIFLKSAASPDKSDTMEESLDSTCDKQKSEQKMIWEKLPHQFFSSF